MHAEDNASDAAGPTGVPFATTHWSVVLAATGGPSPESQDALEALCRAYWLPSYAYARQHGYSPPDAEDLTQDFFRTLFEKGRLARADPDRGRFRTFLLCSMRNFLRNAHDYRTRQKRGGNLIQVSWDRAFAEDRCREFAERKLAPDRLFERHWATTLLERVLAAVRSEFAHTGKAALFDRLTPHLCGEAEATAYLDLAAELDLSPGALRVLVHRLRRRYRDRLRAEVAQTLADPAEADDEIRYLMRIVAE